MQTIKIGKIKEFYQSELKKYSNNNFFIISKSLRENPSIQFIEKETDATSIRFVSGYPSWEEEENYLKLNFNYLKNKSNIITIGGGSSIDRGKILLAFKAAYHELDAKNLEPVDIQDLIKDKLLEGEITAIPTTAGSGSEATSFCTIWMNVNDGIKFSLSHAQLIPSKVFFDPELLVALDKFVLLTTYLDAVSQAIESLMSIKSSRESEFFAIRSLELLFSVDIRSIKVLETSDALTLLKGANYAGKAINITRTGIPHSVSYPLTKLFNIPHGLACFASLQTVLNIFITNEVKSESSIYLLKFADLINKLYSEFKIYELIRNYISKNDFKNLYFLTINEQRVFNSQIEYTKEIFLQIINRIYD